MAAEEAEEGLPSRAAPSRSGILTRQRRGGSGADRLCARPRTRTAHDQQTRTPCEPSALYSGLSLFHRTHRGSGLSLVSDTRQSDSIGGGFVGRGRAGWCARAAASVLCTLWRRLCCARGVRQARGAQGSQLTQELRALGSARWRFQGGAPPLSPALCAHPALPRRRRSIRVRSLLRPDAHTAPQYCSVALLSTHTTRQLRSGGAGTERSRPELFLAS